jgi:hypothetical protein
MLKAMAGHSLVPSKSTKFVYDASQYIICVDCSYTSPGYYVFLYSIGTQTLYCGARAGSRLHIDHGTQIEFTSRINLKAHADPSLVKIIHKFRSDTYGWTFAGLYKDNHWIDLTERDPDFYASAQFPHCKVFYGEPIIAARDHVKNWIIAAKPKQVVPIFEGKPLDLATAKLLMDTFDAKKAVRLAKEYRHPIASDLEADAQ